MFFNQLDSFNVLWNNSRECAGGTLSYGLDSYVPPPGGYLTKFNALVTGNPHPPHPGGTWGIRGDLQVLR